MKKYWKQIVGAVILLLVIILIGKATHHRVPQANPADQMVENKNVVHGEVTANFEGKSTFKYKFTLLDGATTTISKDNRLVTIKNASSSPIHFYFSYEGGRGYSAKDYINNTIASQVSLVKREEMVHGGNTWSVARSANSSWHVGQFGQWLVVIENVNADKDIATQYIESFASEDASSTMSQIAPSDVTGGDADDIATTTATTTHEMY